MKKRLLLIIMSVISALMLSSCINIKGPSQNTPLITISSVPTESSEPTESLSPAVTPTAEASNQQEPSPSAAAPTEPAVEESCSYITAISMRMDGQCDITFDFVDWLGGDEAVQMYLKDHPGATEEDMEGEGIYEMGYIRNVNSALRTFRTTTETKYMLPDEMDMSENIEVSYDEFRDSMFPAVTMGVDEHLKFVNVTVKGEEIIKIEWLYTP